MSEEKRALLKAEIIELLENVEIYNEVKQKDTPDEIYNILEKHVPEGRYLSEIKAKNVIEEFIKRKIKKCQNLMNI